MKNPEINYISVKHILEQVDLDFDPQLSSKLDLTEYAKKLTEKSIVFAKTENNTLIGLCAVYMTDRDNLLAYLSMLAIHPEHRGKGLAKELITEMEESVALNGFKKVRLEVYRTNQGALSMYLKLGYVIAESSENSFFLQKNINSNR